MQTPAELTPTHDRSILRRWDPRWKFVAMGILLLCVAVDRPARFDELTWRRDLPPALGALALAVIFLGLARTSWSSVWRALRPLTFFVVVLLIVFPLFFPDDGWRVAGIELSPTGWRAAILIALRAVAMLLLAFATLASTPFDTTIKALASLRVPRGFLQIVAFTYRYFFAYADQIGRMRLAARARGFRPQGGFRTAATFANLLGVMLVGSLERSQRVYAAMRSRGFTGRFPELSPFRATAADVILAAGTVLLGAAIVLWRLL